MCTVTEQRPLPAVLASMLLAVLLCACAADRDLSTLYGASAADIIVVDATLIVDQPLPDLFLRRTVDPAQPYSPEAAAVTDATVRITGDGASHVYRADPDSAGRYLPPEAAPLVAPVTRYELEVRVAERIVRAATLTPPRMRVEEAVVLDAETLEVRGRLRLFAEVGEAAFTSPENQIVYRTGLLEVRVQPVAAVAYQLALFNLEEDSEFLLDESFLEDADAEDFDRLGASPPVAAPEGRFGLPWFGVAFAGRYLVRVYAVDQNWFDYVRSTGGEGGVLGGLLGDAFERPIFNLEDGIGLFGSASVDSVGFVVLPRTAALVPPAASASAAVLLDR